MQQSVDFVSVIPIKKRRFPILESASISSKETHVNNDEIFNSRTDKSDLSNSTLKENPVCKQESNVFTCSTDKSDLSKSTAIVVDTNSNVEKPESNTKKPEPAIKSDSTVDLRNKVGSFIAEECEKDDGLPKSSVVDAMAVKQENELPLVPEPAIRHCSEQKNSENKCEKSNGSDPLLLSLDLGKEKIDTCDKNDQNGIKDHEDSQPHANRSNWDLNMSMEDWEGSTNNDSVSGMSEFSNVTSSSNHDAKTTAGIVGFCLTKGERTLRNRSSMASLLPSQGNEAGDSLGLSLGVLSREFDASGKQAILPKQSDTIRVGLDINEQRSIMSLAGQMPVKSEPVTEVSQSEFSTKSSNSEMGLSNSTSSKREVVEKQNGPQKLAEHVSIKSELIHESYEVSKFNDSVRLQRADRVMQHQESTASSVMTVPLMPQNPSPTSSTCTELNISKEQPQFSFHSEEALNHMSKLHEQITAVVSKPFSQDGHCNEGNLSVENPEKLELTQIDGHSFESRGKAETVANEEEKINLSTEMLEEDFLGSDSESYENRGVSTPKKLCNKEGGEYEEGEVRTPLQNSTREDFSVNTKKTGKDLDVLQPFVLSGDQSTNTSDYDGKFAISEHYDETHRDHIKECVISGYEPITVENSAEKMAVNDPEIKFDEKKPVGVTIEKRVDVSRDSRLHDMKKGYCEEVTDDGPSTGQVYKATDTVNKQICSAKHDSTLSTVDESNGNGGANDSNNAASNKSRIINLPRASADTSYKTKFFPNREFVSSGGNDKNYDFDWDTQPRGNRNEHYSDKFAKDRARDPSFRNSRPRFMRGKGRGYGRFGPSRNDWSSDKDFAAEIYNGPSNYRGNRNKHTSDSDRGGYKRNVMNDEKFVRHLLEDTIDPSYNRSQNMYEEFDGQLIRDKRNFSVIQRKGYPQMTSKSPVSSHTHSPGPWPSRRRRSPDGIQELNQHRSPSAYRMRRIRSPEHSYHEEMVSRRHGGSPPFITRHSDDLRDVDAHVHPRSFNSIRRSPSGRDFPRSERRDVLDAREVGDITIEERRKFIERRGGIIPVRPIYNGDGDNFHFQHNDSPRPYRFCPDGNTDFSERSNLRERDFDERNSARVREFGERNTMREMEFDGRMKKQTLVASRRIRGDIEEQHEGSYRSKGRVWHNDGFDDVSEQKRRRF